MDSMRPFLKWAGGKTRLVDTIAGMLPPARTLLEPFAGSCAVSLGMCGRPGTGFERFVLADTNADLVSLYQTIKDKPADILEACKELFVPGNFTAGRFYALREEFNKIRMGEECKRLRDSLDDAERLRVAALFVYLNRNCYNGLCRYSRAGKFNVPHGGYKNPMMPENALEDFATGFVHQAGFVHGGFEEVMGDLLARARAGDAEALATAVYCDPPYSPLTPTASFDTYSMDGFSPEQHERLADLCRDLAAAGVSVLLSNHDVPAAAADGGTRKLYSDRGARLRAIDVRRSISGKAERRGKVRELLALFLPAGMPEPALLATLPTPEQADGEAAAAPAAEALDAAA
jgi:DNA adenine methylase